MIEKRIRLGKEQEKQPGKVRATALGFEPDRDNAPRVLATGQGKIAQQIINLAIANHIPLREDPILAAALSNIDINEEIPPELYAVVAEVFAYVYRIHNKHLQK
jgi:flagellar biosynthesis protein